MALSVLRAPDIVHQYVPQGVHRSLQMVVTITFIVPRVPMTLHIVPRVPMSLHIVPRVPMTLHIVPRVPMTLHIVPRVPMALHIVPRVPMTLHIVLRVPVTLDISAARETPPHGAEKAGPTMYYVVGVMVMVMIGLGPHRMVLRKPDLLCIRPRAP